MATISSTIKGSPLIGSPITIQVTAGSYNNPTFHRVRVGVVAGIEGGNFVTIEMSSPVNEGETIKIDISSALRAVADNYEYTSTPPTYYPYVKYYLMAWDEYMINGVTYESSKDYFPDNCHPHDPSTSTPFKGLIGAYRDLERLLAGDTKTTNKFSRKPTTMPEVVCAGETLVRPVDMVVHSGNIEHGQQSVVYNVTSTGTQTIGGVSVYVLPADTLDRYQFRFINGLGCMESVSVKALRTTNVNFNIEQNTVALQETFNQFSRGFAVKQNDYETWKMSAGPLDEAWQEWYLHEFLMARWVWIKIGTLWIPCNIIPEETVTGISRENDSLLEVNFSVVLGINGSPLSSIAV